MNRACPEKLIPKAVRTIILAAAILLTVSFTAPAGIIQPELALQIGERGPLFSVTTSRDSLADYNRDYYGSHHLVLTFFPAAFTPV